MRVFIALPSSPDAVLSGAAILGAVIQGAYAIAAATNRPGPPQIAQQGDYATPDAHAKDANCRRVTL